MRDRIVWHRIITALLIYRRQNSPCAEICLRENLKLSRNGKMNVFITR